MATVTYAKATRIYPGTDRARRRRARPRDRRRRVPRPGRPLRLWQVHQPAHARRPGGRRPAARSTSTSRDVTHLPPKARDIAMVFQNYALYPHMTVYENMAFALKLRKTPKAEIDRRVKEAARAARSWRSTSSRKPKALSGGQRQRVAMGRAIVREPQVFLMDEPLSNLDAKLRVQTRSQIATLQAQARRHHRLRDPRPGRGHDDGPPRGRAARRRAPAGGHARGRCTTSRPTCSSPASSARRR